MGGASQLLGIAKRNPIITALVVAIAAAAYLGWRLDSVKGQRDLAEQNLRVSKSNFSQCSDANAVAKADVEAVNKQIEAQAARGAELQALNDQLSAERDRFREDLERAVLETRNDVNEIFDANQDCAAWRDTRLCPELIERLWDNSCAAGHCEDGPS